MMRKWRSILYGVIGAAVLITALAAPAAWATPGQSSAIQSIPTRTATPPPVTPTEPPADTPVPPSATPAPGNPTQPPAVPPPSGTGVAPVAPAPTAAATSAACASTLTLVSDSQAVWPGATVVFTATLTNTGRQPLLNVVLEDTLAAGLEPVAVLSGNGTWQDRTLRVATPALDPGQRLVAAYSARVAATQPGQAITARAAATSGGCPRKTAAITLGLPPSQLPATGGCLE